MAERAKTNPDPRRVWLEEKDCERMTRTEFSAVRGLIGAVHYIDGASKDLEKRLQSIPSGKQRMAMAKGAVNALANDLVGTMTAAQCKQMQNVMSDMKMQIVPKLSPNSTNVILQIGQVKDLVTCAQEKCRLCIATDEDARRCNLYKVLEAITPLDDYGNGMTCPYYRAEIE